MLVGDYNPGNASLPAEVAVDADQGILRDDLEETSHLLLEGCKLILGDQRKVLAKNQGALANVLREGLL